MIRTLFQLAIASSLTTTTVFAQGFIDRVELQAIHPEKVIPSRWTMVVASPLLLGDSLFIPQASILLPNPSQFHVVEYRASASGLWQAVQSVNAPSGVRVPGRKMVHAGGELVLVNDRSSLLSPQSPGGGLLRLSVDPLARLGEILPPYAASGFVAHVGYGRAVDGSARWLAVDSARNRAGLPDGGVDVYERVGQDWRFSQKLWPSHAPVSQLGGFGRGVAIDGRRAAVAVNTPSQAVAIFEVDGAGAWSQTATLFPQHPTGDLAFGWSSVNNLAISGDWAFVGDPGIVGAGIGRVFVYRDTGNGPMGGWAQVQVLDGTQSGDRFGMDLAVDDGVLAVTAPGIESAMTYSLENSAWVPRDRLLPSAAIQAMGAPSAGGSTGFGFSVSMDNGRIAVSAPSVIGPQGEVGAVLVY